jgi:prepilin-type N-terminal cleavage/methylation domain-containing protein
MTRRRGTTLVEMLLALAALAVAAVLAAQLGTGALSERTRADARLDALDAAGNVLESARAAPWDGLTPDWAAGQKLPAFAADRLTGGALTATVEPEPGRPRVKRVTVEVRWNHRDGQPARPVRLVGLFAARAAEGGNR